MRPYLEAYRLAAVTALEILADGKGGPPDRRALVQQALERGIAAFLAGGIALRESVSKATLENAVEWMVAQRLLAEDRGKLALGDADALRRAADGMGKLLSA
jgi:glycerol-3-phosphate O-acyltransferase